MTRETPSCCGRWMNSSTTLICYLSKRTVIVDTLLPLHRKTRRYRRISMEDWSRTINTRKEHRAILDAMASGDADLGGEPHGKAYRKREKAHVGRIQKSWVRQSHRKSLRPIWSPGT